MAAVILDPPPHETTLLLRKLDIFNRPTPITNKMKMPVPICLVYVKGAPESKAVRHALVNENVEVTIDVTQTERGKLAAKLIVDPVGGHMDVPGLQQFENSLALFTLPQLCAHVYNIVNGNTVVNES